MRRAPLARPARSTFRPPSTFTRASKSGSRTERRTSVCAAVWNTTSGLNRVKTSRSATGSQISTRSNCGPGGMLPADPVERSSTTQTVRPLATRRSTIWEPMNPAPPLDIDAIGVALKQTARALDDVDPAVRAWEVRVVADADGSPVCRLDQADVHVTQDVLLLPLWGALGEMLAGVQLQSPGGGARRDQRGEAIAAIDVHAVGDRTQSVRRVEIAVAFHRMRAAPQPLTFAAELYRTQVVHVPALGVQDFAEHALADHVEDHHLHPAVVAVLHHDAVLPVLLGVLDESPAVIHGVGGGHLGGGVLAIAHRRETDRDVPFPRRGVEYQV